MIRNRTFSVVKVLLFQCMFFFTTVYGKTIYVASGGSDDGSGTSVGSPFGTITKAKDAAKAGDTICLKRGDVFMEQVSLPDKVSLGAYGDGEAMPVVSGAETITGFTPIAENSAVLSATAQHAIKNLYINGRLMRIARYPNSGWLRTTANNSSSTVVGCGALASHLRNGDDYWKGCRMRWRFWSWFFDTRVITGYTADGTMRLAGEPSEGSGNGETGWGFYIDGKREELDTAGEWYFDSDGKTVFCYPPAGVNLAEALVEGEWRDKGIGMSNATADGIWFRSFSESGLEVTRTSVVSNCRFSAVGGDSGGAALSVTWDASGVNIHNCRFEECLNLAISWVQNPATKVPSYIERNTFTNIGSVPGYGGNGPWHAAGIILNVGGNIHVQYNTFDTTGYAAILLGGAGNFAEHNIIRHAMHTLNDGAGIYTNCDSSTIRKNIIMYGGGGWESTGWEIRLAHGIWPEFLGHFKNNIIDSNTCAFNNGNGIFFPNNFTSLVRGNVCYGNLGEAQMYMEGGFYTDDNNPLHDTVIGNTFFSTDKNGVALSYRPDYSYGVIKDNRYCNPQSDNVISEQIEWNTTPHTLAWWKTNWEQYDREATTDYIRRADNAAEGDLRGTSKLLVNYGNLLQTVVTGDNGVYLDDDSSVVSGGAVVPAYYSKVVVHTGQTASVASHHGTAQHITACTFVGASYPHFMLTVPTEALVNLQVFAPDGRTVCVVRQATVHAGTHPLAVPVHPATGCCLYRMSIAERQGGKRTLSGRFMLTRK